MINKDLCFSFCFFLKCLICVSINSLSLKSNLNHLSLGKLSLVMPLLPTVVFTFFYRSLPLIYKNNLRILKVGKVIET